MSIFSYKSNDSFRESVVVLSDIMSNCDESENKTKIITGFFLKSPGILAKATCNGIIIATCIMAWWAFPLIICDDLDTKGFDGIGCIPWWIWLVIIAFEIFLAFLCVIGYKQEVRGYDDRVISGYTCSCCWLNVEEVDNIV